jgi:aminoglycoside 6'-N-acetyltransferase
VTTTELRGEQVILRPVGDRAGDLAALVTIRSEPEVARWWGAVDESDMAEAFPRGWVIEVDGTISGWIEWWEEDDPEYRHAGLDIYLSARCHGRGLGADAVRTACRWLLEERGHHRLVIDPAAANEVAIACYRKVGFRPVGVMRRYELDTLSGTWRDGLLMDLLPEELT